MTPTEWLEQSVRITREGVWIGEHQLPGVIAQDGVTVSPGMADSFNKLTVEFYVGPVTVEDAYAQEHVNIQPAGE
ncbi:hypothetical protein [Mycobacterium sp. CnD-18-1]|uniref:hypothetical protein n=1 Tax=Mycobacterium sp. CnD-18-1 TaxID=2917744 RepID=UPI001EF307BC|nr:hypothetical protein [Mycobacterium sp. CnD-18-1]MCG7607098.1 hypothetical protein [Mycobacterium sp. CnD-18-1]